MWPWDCEVHYIEDPIEAELNTAMDALLEDECEEAGADKGWGKRMKQKKLEECEAVLRWPRVYTYTVRDRKLDGSIQTTLEEYGYVQGEGDKDAKVRAKESNETAGNVPGPVFFLYVHP